MVYIADAPTVPDPKTAADVAAAIKVISASGVEVKTLDALITAGIAKPCAPSPPKPSDLAIIMYTSGTTGLPKGVKISHSNVVATVAGLEKKTPGLFPGKSDSLDLSDQTYLAYMPLAHIMEMAGELMAFTMNITIGYGSPHTLTPTGVKIMPDTCKGDAQVCQPTLLVMAPAILDKVFVGLQVRQISPHLPTSQSYLNPSPPFSPPISTNVPLPWPSLTLLVLSSSPFGGSAQDEVRVTARPEALRDGPRGGGRALRCWWHRRPLPVSTPTSASNLHPPHLAPAHLPRPTVGSPERHWPPSPCTPFGGIGPPSTRAPLAPRGSYNKIVFKKVQALLGGKLQAVITGSAPLAPGIQKFAQTVFNCPVRQGYGLTETCASSCIGEPFDNSCGQVGTPLDLLGDTWHGLLTVDPVVTRGRWAPPPSARVSSCATGQRGGTSSPMQTTLPSVCHVARSSSADRWCAR